MKDPEPLDKETLSRFSPPTSPSEAEPAPPSPTAPTPSRKNSKETARKPSWQRQVAAAFAAVGMFLVYCIARVLLNRAGINSMNMTPGLAVVIEVFIFSILFMAPCYAVRRAILYP